MDRPDSKFQLISQILSDPLNTMSVQELCELNHVSRSGYYAWTANAPKRAEKEAQDRKDFELILEAYKAGGYPKGAKRIQATLLHKEEPIQMNLKKIRRLMKKYKLVCPIRRANPYRRMQKELRTNTVMKNEVKRRFEEFGPRKVLLTDITYIPYNGTFAYLSTVLDAYTKEILGYKLSSSLEVDFVLDTLEQVMDEHESELQPDATIHSDQGAHYTSHKFIELVRSQKLRQSMSRRGNCWDNAPQESFFGHMKDEIKDQISRCQTFEEVKKVIDDWIHYYNTERYQWRLAKLSPSEFYQYITTGQYPLENVTPFPIQVGQKKKTADQSDKAREKTKS